MNNTGGKAPAFQTGPQGKAPAGGSPKKISYAPGGGGIKPAGKSGFTKGK